MSILGELTNTYNSATNALEGLVNKEKPNKTIDNPISDLEKELLNSPESVGYSTKLKIVNEKLTNLKSSLKKEKNKEKKASLEQEINLAMREKARLIQFYSIKDKGNESQKEIIKNTQSHESLRASDILFLKKKGADLAKLLLVKGNDYTKEVNSSKIEEKDSFVVNFGENKNINAIIGAGDIFSSEIKKIKINGKEAQRKAIPRPGYFDEKGKYLPIFDGDKIEIIKKGPSTGEEELEETKMAQDRFEKMRLDDMIDGKGNFSGLEEDKNLLTKVEQRKAQREEERKKWGAYNEFKKEKFIETFGKVLDEQSAKYNIPKEVVINLISKESQFNPQAKNSNSSAYGLGQFLDSTWKQVANFGEFNNIDLDRYNPEHQIMGVFAYLNNLRNLKNCSIAEAVVYYHTGPFFSDKHVPGALAINAPIRKLMNGEPTARNYMIAAAKFYGVEAYS